MLSEMMKTSTFNAFQKLFYEKAGIRITSNKTALVAARVGKRMRELSVTDYNDYLDILIHDEKGTELIHLLDAISTNVTSFFRENSHFDFLKVQFGKWLDTGQRKFRFWSAASSTGEEPYTMAMVLLDKINDLPVDAKILATDLSTKVLASCIKGIYPQEKIAPVPPDMVRNYFNEQKDGKERCYAVKAEIKKMVTFSRINLSKTPFPMSGPFDAVFCRNVMIYFDNPVREKLLNEIYRLLKNGGFLFVGHAESLTGILSGFKTVQPSVYQKP